MADLVRLFSVFERPWVLLLIIPIFFVLRTLIRKEFILIKGLKPRWGERRTVLLFRTLVFFLLLLAVASPFSLKTTTVQGDPYVKVLVDNSTSFSLYDEGVGPGIKKELENYVEVEYKQFGDSGKTALGDALLNNLERGGSILVISDGNNNYGASLSDVALYAARLNATINAVRLTQTKDDSSIKIFGPEKVIADVENEYKIELDGKTAKHITVEVDGEKIFDEIISNNVVISKKFSAGSHEIVARIVDADYFSINNIFYKTVKVVPKPKIAFFSKKESPMLQILNELYETEKLASIENYKNKHTLVINDVNSGDLDDKINEIGDYVAEGNGLLFIGGQNSFDKGDYKGSVTETLLPVFTGAGVEEGEKINIVIVMDISKSTSVAFGVSTAEDVEKALALSLLSNIGSSSNVGFVAFNTKPYVVSDISPLIEKRAELESKIRSLIDVGDTYIPVGLAKGIELLEKVPGEKNLILLSDGKSGGSQASANYIKLAAEKDIKVILISVEGGEVRRRVAGRPHEAGYGAQYLYDAVVDSQVESALYFRGLESPQKINVLFGERSGKKPQGSSFLVVVLNDNHFITENLEIGAVVTGFNQVIPKSTAQLLITTDSGEPLLTVWRYGLGRIAVLSTDDGSQWAGELLSKKNSKLITRIMNWAIGDPERRLDKFADISDTRVNEETELTVKDRVQPTAEGVAFYKVGEDLYKAGIKTDKEGFQSILGEKFAANYPLEYEDVSFSSDLEKTVQITSGKMFEAKDIQGMVNAIRTQSRRTIDEKSYLRWPFIIAAIIFFLLEVSFRRLAENRRLRQYY